MTTFPRLVPAKLPPLTAWSYSRYSDYARCPFYFAYKHLLRIKEPAGPALVRGSEIHKIAEGYVTGKGRAPKMPRELVIFEEQFKQLRGMDVVHVEQQWGFTNDWSPTGWFGDDTWVRVVVDAGVLYDDNTADVIDHKTGKKYPTNEDQMELFGLATFKKFPNLVHVTTRLWYLDIPNDAAGTNEVVREYKIGEVPALERDWNRRVKPMFVDRRFPPRANAKCKWCFLRKEVGGPCKF